MHKMMVLAILMAGAATYAQDVPIPYSIETEGAATVDVAPTYAEFWVAATLTGASVTEAMYKAVQFDSLLRNQISSQSLHPTVISVGSPSVQNIAEKQVKIAARLQFPATAFNAPENGPVQFSALCDQMLSVAAALHAEAVGPVLGVDDSVAVQQTAIQKALEKAYPSAKAAADIMNGQIIAVAKVNLIGITWNDTGGTPLTLPDTRRMTCSAQVRVTYFYNPGM